MILVPIAETIGAPIPLLRFLLITVTLVVSTVSSTSSSSLSSLLSHRTIHRHYRRDNWHSFYFHYCLCLHFLLLIISTTTSTGTNTVPFPSPKQASAMTYKFRFACPSSKSSHSLQTFLSSSPLASASVKRFPKAAFAHSHNSCPNHIHSNQRKRHFFGLPASTGRPIRSERLVYRQHHCSPTTISRFQTVTMSLSSFKRNDGHHSQYSNHSSSSSSTFAASSMSSSHTTKLSESNHTTRLLHDRDTTCDDTCYQVFLSIGTNLGDRYHNIHRALQLLCHPDEMMMTHPPDHSPHSYQSDNNHQNDKLPSSKDTSFTSSSSISSNTNTITPSYDCRIVSTSWLYETAPMYVLNQPSFWNGIVQIETNMSPWQLLQRIKRIEHYLGRQNVTVPSSPDVVAVVLQQQEKEEKEVSGSVELQDNNNPNNDVDDSDSTPVTRNGPRPIDLDILFYLQRRHHQQQQQQQQQQDRIINNANIMCSKNEVIDYDNWEHMVLQMPDNVLTIPHPKMAEREFVLLPMCDIPFGRDLKHPLYHVTVKQLYHNLLASAQSSSSLSKSKVSSHLVHEDSAHNDNNPPEAAKRILPLPRRHWHHRQPQQSQREEKVSLNPSLRFDNQHVMIMGIMNVTPDSFSDGNRQVVTNVDVALHRALEMVQDGADIIDIGGESTRPGAKEVEIEEELRRTVPLISKLRQVSDVVISIDTRHAAVAGAAVEAGADIVNDVSGGTFDSNMLPTVAELKVPIILMHMRGIPETMQEFTQYDDLVIDVANALLKRSRNAEAHGIPRWLQVLDPGIGFAKDMNGNLALLKNLGKLRSLLSGAPLVLGTSRKGFIGRITGQDVPADRDYGTVAANVAALCLEHNDDEGAPSGCTILRVHNVRAMREATAIMKAIKNTP